MTMVRSDADAMRAARALQAGDHGVDEVRFENWPLMVLDATDGFDVIHCSSRLRSLQDRVERQFAILKYGTNDRRYLTLADKADVHLHARYVDGGNRLVIDFTGAANASARMVAQNSLQEQSWATAPLFASEDDDTENKESWSRTVRESMRDYISKLTPTQATRIGMLAVVVGFVGFTGYFCYKASLEYSLAIHTEDNAHQQRMAALEQNVTRADGKRAKLTAKAEKSLAVAAARETDSYKQLTAFELESPLVWFVADEAAAARAEILDLAPETGTLSLNAADLSAATARVAAKTLKKARRARPPIEIINGWEPKVQQAIKS